MHGRMDFFSKISRSYKFNLCSNSSKIQIKVCFFKHFKALFRERQNLLDSFQFVIFLLSKDNNKLKAVAEILSFSEQCFEMF